MKIKTTHTGRVHTVTLSDAELRIIERALDEYTNKAVAEQGAVNLWDDFNTAVVSLGD